MPKRASEVRASLYFIFLSKARRDRVTSLEEGLDDLYAFKEKELGFAIKPHGPTYVTPQRDILIALMEGKIVGALSIEKAPRLEGLALDPDVEFPQVVFDQLTSRAEGVLMAQGFTWYDLGIPENFSQRYLDKMTGSTLTWEQMKSSFIRIFRRFL